MEILASTDIQYICADIRMIANPIFYYGTARFKLEARVRVTRVYFVAPLEYFSKSCVSVENCTRILRAIHARMTSPNMLAYVRSWTHVTIHTHSLRNFDRHQ